MEHVEQVEQVGFTSKLIPDEAKFQKFTTRYHIVVIATLYCLLTFVFLKGEYEMFNLATLEISKLSFRWVMGVLASMMASAYLMSLFVRAYFNAVGSSSTYRTYEEMAMFYGFLTLFFFVMNLYGFWGFICVLLLIAPLGFASYKNLLFQRA